MNSRPAWVIIKTLSQKPKKEGEGFAGQNCKPRVNISYLAYRVDLGSPFLLGTYLIPQWLDADGIGKGPK